MIDPQRPEREPVFPSTDDELAQYDERRRAANEQQMATAETLDDKVLAHCLFMRTFEDEVRRLSLKMDKLQP